MISSMTKGIIGRQARETGGFPGCQWEEKNLKFEITDAKRKAPKSKIFDMGGNEGCD
jgi:hypothetical protein